MIETEALPQTKQQEGVKHGPLARFRSLRTSAEQLCHALAIPAY
jgi:hypothetical protein